MKQPIVQIRAIDSYDLPAIEDAVSQWFDQLRDPKLKRSKRVLIKPNTLGAYHPDRAVTTHPVVLEAIIRYFLKRKKEVWMGDSPGGTVSVQKVWETCGWQDLAERYPIKLVNLSTSGYRELKYDGIPVKVSEVLFQCGIVINVAKYKTHSLMTYTGALKNLYGLVPGMIKSEYHRLNPDTRSFAELLLALYGLCRNKITYSIIDGIVGMDGNGPSAGNPKPFGLLMGSDNIPALDTIAAQMMGLKVTDVPYLWGALHREGILPSRIKVPHSFIHHRLPDVDIRMVKMSKESLKYMPKALRYAFRQVYYYYPQVSERCVRCGVCVKSCPVSALAWQQDGFPKVDKDICIKCMCCHELCPTQAIDIHKSFVARMFLK
ncbi:MAG: DUF362 domain-containing protein [Candidatus Cloacimonetes bacterium]|nr:DUF362 domain-containing protein [Candidatus Cloacimonadota bacterium]MCB5287415.1 DUF362 domain-containing protein [Candidatus Cloacimonadota bacterium]MCK9184201.1 DUF362 domain-containing protein [Candidatus Cloacimonadota bacterium]MDY0229736.1 DUF362 domain-containing protein [Candidatus Cloacimonadaceae bacterium]